MAPRHRQPCAGGMLHHVDVNTEQANTATASYFTYLSCALGLASAISYLSSVQTDPPAFTQSDVSSGGMIQCLSLFQHNVCESI